MRRTESLRDGLDVIGAPVPGGMGFQPGVTSLAHDVRALDTFLLVIMTGIVLFVTALILWSILRPQCPREPDARDLHPQHQDRDHLDRRPASHPRGHRGLLAPGAVPPADHSRRRCRHQDDRLPVVLGLRIPRGGDRVPVGHARRGSTGRVRLHPRRIPPRDRCRHGRADRADHRRAGHRGGRDPFLDSACLRREAGRRSGAPRRTVVRGRSGAGGRLFRPVFRALRHRACLYAHHRLRRDAPRNTRPGWPARRRNSPRPAVCARPRSSNSRPWNNAWGGTCPAFTRCGGTRPALRYAEQTDD